MSLSLIPARLYDRYSDITAAELRSLGVTLLLCDLDFTLAPKKVRRPDAALRRWIADLRFGGVDFMIVSNNRSGRRVADFCAELGVPYQGHCNKPSTRGLRKAMERAGADAAHTAMLGDKLLTDVLAANRTGILPLMVEPAGGAVGPWQKVLHAMQEPFKNVCRRRGGQRTGTDGETGGD
ncbi:MAG: HAD-IIIA family hydrolase [Oscillibacter sp.]|nr:HAD-IIIA family hydrolase [Oscillibacter sp.]